MPPSKQTGFGSARAQFPSNLRGKLRRRSDVGEAGLDSDHGRGPSGVRSQNPSFPSGLQRNLDGLIKTSSLRLSRKVGVPQGPLPGFRLHQHPLICGAATAVAPFYLPGNCLRLGGGFFF